MSPEDRVHEYPKLSNGFFKNDIFRDEDGEKKWVVGDLGQGSQFILTNAQMTDFEYFLQYLDGTNSLEDIAEKTNRQQKEIQSALSYMEKKGLIQGVEGKVETRFNEVDQFSISLFTSKFSDIKKRATRDLARRTLSFMDILLVVNIFLLLVSLFRSLPLDLDFSKLLTYGQGKKGQLLGYLLINLGMILSFLLHECGHLLAGVKNGIQPEKFQFSLFLGFIPMFYIKNKNIYSLPQKKILEVLLAGIKVNLVLALVLINVYIFSGWEILRVLAISNIRLIIVNTFPLTLSDGYFVLTVTTGFSNLRQNYHMFLASPKKWKDFMSVEKVYVLLAFCTLIVTLLFEVQWFLTLLPIGDNRLKVFFLIIFFSSYLFFMHYRNAKRFASELGQIKTRERGQTMKRKKKIDTKIKLCFLISLIATMTLCISLNALPILEESLRQDLRQSTVGQSEYIVTKEDKELIKDLTSQKNYQVAGAISFDGSVKKREKKRQVQVLGMNYKDFISVFGQTYNEKGQVSFPKEMDKDTALLSPKLGSFLDAKDGDIIRINLFDQQKVFKVKIAPKDNYFVKANENQILVDKGKIQDLLDLKKDESTHNYLYKVNDPVALEKSFEGNDKLTLEKSIDDQYIKTNMTTYFGIELVVFFFVIVISYDIMSAAGLIFMKERSKEIGTYFSVGFEKNDVFKRFRNLALKIALMGAGIGVALAIVVLHLFSLRSLNQAYLQINDSLIYFLISGLISTLLIIFIMVNSFMKPLRRMAKESTRSLLLSESSLAINNRKASTKDLIWLFFILIFGFLIFFVDLEYQWLKALLIIPFSFSIFKVFSILAVLSIKKTNRTSGNGLALISMKNVANNFYLKKTLKLTTKISIFMIIVGVLIFSILEAMTGFYKDYYADAFIRLSPQESFSDMERNKMDSIKGIDETLYYSSQTLTLIPKGKEREVSALGLDDLDRYNSQFVNMKPVWKEGFNIGDFTKGDYVILSEILMEKYKLVLGDNIAIKDGTHQKNFEIVGYARSLQNLGDLIYLNRRDKDFAKGMPLNGAYLKGKISEDFEEDIPNFIERDFSYRNVANMREDDLTNGMQVIIFFLSFGLLIAVTSLAGIYGNYRLSYFTRRRELAVLSSNGYSKGEIKGILKLEIIINSILSVLISIILFFLLKKPIEEIIKLVDLPIQLHLTNEALISLVIMIAIISLINMSLVGKSVKDALNNRVEYLKER